MAKITYGISKERIARSVIARREEISAKEKVFKGEIGSQQTQTTEPEMGE